MKIDQLSVSTMNYQLIGLLIKKERLTQNMIQSSLIDGICKRGILSELENGKMVKDRYYFLIASKLNKTLVIDENVDDELYNLCNIIYNNCYRLNVTELIKNRQQLEIILKGVKDTLYYGGYYDALTIIFNYFINDDHSSNYDYYQDIYHLFNKNIEELLLNVFYMYYSQVCFDLEKINGYLEKINSYNTPLAKCFRIKTLSGSQNYLIWMNEYEKIENELLLDGNYRRLLNIYINKLSFADILGEQLGDITLHKTISLIDQFQLDSKYKSNAYYNRGVSLMRRNKMDKAIKMFKQFEIIRDNVYVSLIIASFEHKCYLKITDDNLILIEYFNCPDESVKVTYIPKIIKELKRLNNYPLINAFKYECHYICKKTKHYKYYFDYLDIFEYELKWEVK